MSNDCQIHFTIGQFDACESQLFTLIGKALDTFIDVDNEDKIAILEFYVNKTSREERLELQKRMQTKEPEG